QRLLDMAERFNLPVFTFIDTMGAYPGVGAEERGQAEAIATSLAQLSNLKVPVIATVLGEGGSGGALGIGVADRVVMLSHSIYSVISPEGCASILWKTAEKAEQASEALALTAEKLQKKGIVEYVVDEVEGAHLNPDHVMNSVKAVLKEALNELQPMEAQARCEARYQRLMKFGSDNLGLVSKTAAGLFCREKISHRMQWRRRFYAVAASDVFFMPGKSSGDLCRSSVTSTQRRLGQVRCTSMSAIEYSLHHSASQCRQWQPGTASAAFTLSGLSATFASG